LKKRREKKKNCVLVAKPWGPEEGKKRKKKFVFVFSCCGVKFRSEEEGKKRGGEKKKYSCDLRPTGKGGKKPSHSSWGWSKGAFLKREKKKALIAAVGEIKGKRKGGDDTSLDCRRGGGHGHWTAVAVKKKKKKKKRPNGTSPDQEEGGCVEIIGPGKLKVGEKAQGPGSRTGGKEKKGFFSPRTDNGGERKEKKKGGEKRRRQERAQKGRGPGKK